MQSCASAREEDQTSHGSQRPCAVAVKSRGGADSMLKARRPRDLREVFDCFSRNANYIIYWIGSMGNSFLTGATRKRFL